MRLRTIAIAAFVLSCSAAQAETGKASWYGAESGTHTVSGEKYRPNDMTVAHRTMSFGAKLRITDHHTGRAVICRVSDRGPAKRTGRVVDLSKGCASALGIIRRGIAMVSLEVVN